MDLPLSGWYPDPYGTPDLLRWWDGSNWTHHTHPALDVADTGGGGAAGGAAGGGASGASGMGALGGEASGGAQQGAVQATMVQPATVQPATVQPATVQPTGGGWAARDRVIGDWAGTDWPTGEQLAATKPPKGPRTEPQPALPSTAVQPSVQSLVQATRYQPAVQPTAYQPAVQPTTVQAPAGGGWGTAAVQPTTVQPTTVQAGGGPSGGGAGVDGTQVLFLGDDAWQLPGGPDGAAQANPYGYQEAQRRRRMWLIGGIGVGTAVAVAIIVVVASSMGGSSGATAADQTRVTPPAPSPTASAAAPASPTASAAAPSVSATPPAAVLSDGQSGLSYSQLAAPWQAGCPSDLSSAFAWTAGESAVAGEVNNGQQTWYGEACSGPLPAQYGYAGPQDLAATAANVASTLETAYYNNLDHTVEPLLSQPVSISGHAGWEVEYTIDYTNAAAQGATWSSEEGAVIVTDTGTGNTPVVFFASVPNASALGTSDVSTLISSLQLSVVPNPAGGDGSPGPGGSPGD